MKFFTPEELQPAESTLKIIRMIARAYPVVSAKGNCATPRFN